MTPSGLLGSVRRPPLLWMVLAGGVAVAAAAIIIANVTSGGNVMGSNVVRRGEAYYQRECQSCHGPTGERLPISPLNSKEFLNSRGDATLVAVISEGKGVMPAFGKARSGPLSEDDIRSVVAFLNSRAGRESTSLLADIGQPIFASNCAACHGANGDRIPIAPLNAKGFLDTKTNGALTEVIISGKGPMPPLGKDKGGPLAETDIAAVIAFMRNRVEERTAQTASRGRDIYISNCLICHGSEGNRIPGVEIASGRYLRSVGDGAILNSVNNGKGSMPAFGANAGGTLGIPDIAALLTYVKTWAGLNATSALTVSNLPGQGSSLFLRNCTGCHGETGDNVPGVRLFSKEFLERETERVLLQTITRGNAQGMPAWGAEAGGPLSQAQIQSILDYLKASAVSQGVTAPVPGQAPTSRPPEDTTVPMTAAAVARGQEIFKGTCAMCHGETRDKVPNCPLPDGNFLKSRGDVALINSITFGKGPMPAWGMARGGPLSPDDVKAAVAYLKSAAGIAEVKGSSGGTTPAPGAVPASQASLVAKGEGIFKGTCAMCHGETRDKVPTCQLASPDWLKTKTFDGVVKAITDGKPPMMPTWGKEKGGPLSSEDIQAVSTYLWSAAGLSSGAAAAAPSAVPASQPPTTPKPDTAPAQPAAPIIPSAKLGQEIFMTRCQMCHGGNGLNIPQCPLGSREWIGNMSLEGLMARIRRGKPAAGMPTWGKVYGGPLSEEEILSVVMHLGQAAR